MPEQYIPSVIEKKRSCLMLLGMGIFLIPIQTLTQYEKNVYTVAVGMWSIISLGFLISFLFLLLPYISFFGYLFLFISVIYIWFLLAISYTSGIIYNRSYIYPVYLFGQRLLTLSQA